jgi:hypothetical protein
MPALTLGGSGGGSGGGYSNEMGVLKASSSVEQFAPSETSAFQANLDEKTGRFLARFTLSQVSALFLSLSGRSCATDQGLKAREHLLKPAYFFLIFK